MAISDPFTYTNGALSGEAAWATTLYAGSQTIASNAITGTASETRGNVRTDEWGAAQSSKLEIITPGSGMFPAVVVHVTGSGATYNGYSFGIDAGGNWFLERVDAGATTMLDTAASTAVVGGDTIRIAIETNDVVGYKNEVEVGRATDTTYRAGKPGFYEYREGASVVVDNWVGTGESVGGATGRGRLVGGKLVGGNLIARMT